MSESIQKNPFFAFYFFLKCACWNCLKEGKEDEEGKTKHEET